MGKEKVKKGPANKHLHARIAFLEKASRYLTVQAQTAQNGLKPSCTTDTGKSDTTHPPSAEVEQTFAPVTGSASSSTNYTLPISFTQPKAGGLPNLYTSQLCSIARKGQIRLSREVKHGICKTCSAPVIDDVTASRRHENLSKNGSKPWAEVLVVRCNACGTVKRFPVGARRQRRKKDRDAGLGTYRDVGTIVVASNGAKVATGDGMEVDMAVAQSRQ